MREEYLPSNRSISPCVARVRRNVCRASMRSQLWIGFSRAGVRKSGPPRLFHGNGPEPPRGSCSPAWRIGKIRLSGSAGTVLPFSLPAQDLLNLENQECSTESNCSRGTGGANSSSVKPSVTGFYIASGTSEKFVIGAQGGASWDLRVRASIRIRPGRKASSKSSLRSCCRYRWESKGFHGAPVSPWGSIMLKPLTPSSKALRREQSGQTGCQW